MDNFINLVESFLKTEKNTSTTENGAVGYKTANSALVDMNFKITSYRNLGDAEIIYDFMRVYKENKELAFKFLFYIRDILEGCGERRLFKVIIQSLAKEGKMPKHLIKYIPEYGRYDDLFVFFGTSAEKEMIEFVTETLTDDIEKASENKSISLLAKWMPSNNTSSIKTVNMARKFERALNISPRDYRKILSKLRAKINIVESDMCANKWEDIKYESVPSKANNLYKNAFLNHDGLRRTQFLSKALTGEAKMNAKTLVPHDIVHSYVENCSYGRVSGFDAALEAMWKNLPNIETSRNTIVVADGSGSMYQKVGKTSVQAVEVANALAIYFAERCNGAFKNKYITFSTNPQLVDMTNARSLRDKINIAYSNNEIANTNIEKVFGLVLLTAVKNKVPQSEIPNILILSDMEFDDAVCSTMTLSPKLFDSIAARYAQYGYSLPKMIFWNIMSSTNTIPVIENEFGVALVSGFSPNTMKMVMSNETNPYKILIETLNSERYKKISLQN